MKKILLVLGLAAAATPAFAQTAPVPEMDGGPAIAALILVAGLAMVRREKLRK